MIQAGARRKGKLFIRRPLVPRPNQRNLDYHTNIYHRANIICIVKHCWHEFATLTIQLARCTALSLLISANHLHVTLCCYVSWHCLPVLVHMPLPHCCCYFLLLMSMFEPPYCFSCLPARGPGVGRTRGADGPQRQGRTVWIFCHRWIRRGHHTPSKWNHSQ